MGLDQYRKKRDLNKSPEPRGGKTREGRLRFVVQKHDATRLHYDFRLEMEGVLKSWAVPKGPSLDTGMKRLAVMVEDHPIDYRNFEGIIPSGYGAGTVMVWDEGFYEPAGTGNKSRKEQERELRRQLRSGKLKFVLHGKKLKGTFALVKAAGRAENDWLLMKLADRYASPEDVLQKNRSVLSRRSLKGIQKAADHVWHSNGKGGEGKKSAKRTLSDKAIKSKTGKKINPGKKKNFSMDYRPMLATPVDKPVDAPGWQYEVKWDGYRALAFVNKGSVEVRSRNDKSFNEKFYPVHDELKSWKINAVVDGEIVVVNQQGISDFSALQNWRSEADGALMFYIFDVLWLEGRDLTELPLKARREILATGIPESEIIRRSENFGDSATAFFEVAKEMNLEGIIAKKADSLYYPGARTKDWLKIKTSKRQEVVIGGYTKNLNSSRMFSALLAGVYKNGKFTYIGKIGTGFNEQAQRVMLEKFKPLTRKKSPFAQTPDVNKLSRFRPVPPDATVTWLKPELVCEVNYTEMTADGIMRHPSFKGMRMDKNAVDVMEEKDVKAEKLMKIGNNKNSSGKVAKKLFASGIKKERKTLLNPSEATQVKKINGHEIRFNNLGKVFWPEEKISKRDLINYYYQVAPFMLPYLKDRPQSLNRHPNGINGKSFYQKDVTGKVPPWIKTYKYHSANDTRDKHFLVVTDEASLLYMASLGCIEINPWSSTVLKPDHPDWCIIDLDPGETTFNKVIEAAQVTKDILDSLGVEAYCKTSGSTGLHIYIPLGAKYTYEQSREFARVIATLVHGEIPAFTSIERVVKKRNGKMYLDFLQNRAQATVAAPYAIRPKPGATVSMPLHWHEVKKGLKMTDFTIYNAIERIRHEGDLFKPVMGKGINLEKIVKQF